MKLNTAVFAPIPSARVRTATTVKPGAFASWRSAYRRSFIRLQSFHPQRFNWIDSSSAARWQPASCERYQSQRHGSAEKRRRIPDAHFVKETCQCATCKTGHEQSGCEPDHDQKHPLPENKPKDIRAIGTKRESDSQLARALRHSQSHDPIQPDARKTQCKPGKNTEENHAQSARREALTDVLVQRRNLGHGLFRIDRCDLALDCADERMRIVPIRGAHDQRLMFGRKLSCGKVHHRQVTKIVLLTWRMDPCVRHNPDDCDRNSGLIRFADCHRIIDLSADWVLPWEKSLCRQFIDNHHARLAGNVLGGESSSA